MGVGHIIRSASFTLDTKLGLLFALGFTLLESSTVGAGHDPDPISPVRCANGASGYTMPFRIVAERSDFPEYLLQSAGAKDCHVFDEDIFRAHFADEPGILRPEP